MTSTTNDAAGSHGLLLLFFSPGIGGKKWHKMQSCFPFYKWPIRRSFEESAKGRGLELDMDEKGR